MQHGDETWSIKEDNAIRVEKNDAKIIRISAVKISKRLQLKLRKYLQNRRLL